MRCFLEQMSGSCSSSYLGTCYLSLIFFGEGAVEVAVSWGAQVSCEVKVLFELSSYHCITKSWDAS